jgi:hypothetical protein
MGTIIRRIFATLVLSAAVATAGAVPAQSAQPPAPDIPVLTGIRTAMHPTFDRIVLDFSGPRPQVSSRFVDELVRPRKFRTANLNNGTAIAITGDYEAYLSVGVGMRKQTWVKAFTLDAPTRVVIDVGR